MSLQANVSLNPNAMKMCLLDIDGVVCDFGEPYKIRDGVIEKVNKLVDEGWTIVAFTTRNLDSLFPLIQQGLKLSGYIPKPVAREMMIVDDVLSEARNQL